MKEPIKLDVIYAVIETLLEAHKGDDKTILTAAGSVVEDDLTAYLTEHAPPANRRQEARQWLRKYRDSFRQNRNPKQGVLFEPDWLIALDLKESHHIRASDVRIEHALKAREVRDAVLKMAIQDGKVDIDYWNSRIVKFRNATETLLDVEKRDFGWTEPVVPDKKEPRKEPPQAQPPAAPPPPA